MKRPLLVVLLAGAMALAGCSARLDGASQAPTAGEETGSDNPGSSPGDRPDDGVVRPPGAALVTQRGTYPGGVGTYCWREGGRGLCLDFVGPVSNLTPITVEAGERVGIEYGAGVPTEANIAWYSVDGSGREPTSDGQLLWTEHPPAFQDPVREDSLVAPSTPGEYLVTVFAVYAGKGDVFYGFYVVVD